jgi:hypothetical protein
MNPPNRTPGWENNFKQSNQVFKERLAKEIEGPVHVYYSAYQVLEDETCVDNLDQVAVTGRCQFVDDDLEESETTYTSRVVENPTWLQVAILANEMIRVREVVDHIFLEGVHEANMANGIKTMNFIMGS